MLLFLIACAADPAADPQPQADAPATTTAGAEPATITIYSGRGESLVGELFERAEAETGVKVSIQYGDTPEMVTRMLSEGAETPADLIFAQDSGHLGALAARDALAPLPRDLLAQVDGRFQDPDGRWIGTSGRMRVLVHSAEVDVADLPVSLKDLADPKWKGKLGWAPGNGSFQAHVSALRSIWGEEETKAWLKAVEANEPTRYPKNSPQVAAAADGAIQIGWVNHYYWQRTKPETAANYRFPTGGDAGNVMMLAGVGVSAHSPNQEAALKVAEWLVSEGVQSYFAMETFEYPTRPGVKTHPDVPALEADTLAEVDQKALADLGPTRAMLQELGLL